LYACNNGDTASTSNDSAETQLNKKSDPTDSPKFQKGLALIKNSDCITCHKMDEKLIGPAFREIANKYPTTSASLDMLAQKIIHGGQGNWGDIPMAAHDNLSVDDATAMAQYVLLLKNN
jgi:cytochrome c